MIASLKTYFLGLIRLSLILTRSKSGVTTEILRGAEGLNNPKRGAGQSDGLSSCTRASRKPGSHVAIAASLHEGRESLGAELQSH
jgi:hypothetical protein